MLGPLRAGNPADKSASGTVRAMDDASRIAELEATVTSLRKRIDDLEAQAQPDNVVKLVPDKRLILGWAYVAKRRNGEQVVDWSGDVVTEPDHLEDVAYDFVEKSRVGNLNHAGLPVATLVESAMFTPEKIEKMGLAEGSMPVGWWCGFRIHDDKVWDDARSGKLRALSIEGSGLRVPR